MKKIVGLVEEVIIYGKRGKKKIFGKFDTGAKMNSIDKRLVEELKLGPPIKYTKITSALSPHGTHRPVVELNIKILRKKYKTRANVSDRSRLKYPLLIGRELIHSNFIVDVAKTNKTPNEGDIDDR